jgi:hypothetical protein
MSKPSSHDHKGNCFDKSYECPDCTAGTLCDVCHAHEQPRGECDDCPDCPECPPEIGRTLPKPSYNACRMVAQHIRDLPPTPPDAGTLLPIPRPPSVTLTAEQSEQLLANSGKLVKP